MNDDEFRPTEEALTFLLSSEGRALLDRLTAQGVEEAALLQHTVHLRKRFSPAVSAAALDLVLLRQRARNKFTRADEMFFTRQALEQASAEVISRYRAGRFAGRALVADLCCGIGGDTIALAAVAEVLALDIDPVRLRMTTANLGVYGVARRVRTACADATAHSLPPGSALWADPSRRAGGKRVFSLHDYHPPLSALLGQAAQAPGAGIKLSPGVSYDELGGLLGKMPHEVEIVSVHGEAREAVLWLGDLRTSTHRRATLLPGGHTLTWRPLQAPIPVTPVSRYLYEPDAAVIRAHLVEHLAEEMHATKIDPQIAYLTSGNPIESPYATAYAVEETMPFHLKRINRRLRAMEIGELVIKKRGLPVDPEQFRRRLKYGGGTRRVVLVLTRVQDRPTALICRPVSTSTGR